MGGKFATAPKRDGIFLNEPMGPVLSLRFVTLDPRLFSGKPSACTDGDPEPNFRITVGAPLSISVMNPDTAKYNKALASADREICDLLAKEIDRSLSEAENKIWHAHPVWFLDGNPIVGYGKLKDSIRLLFWSGQSFEEATLKNEGSFKAAEVRYTSSDQIDKADLKRWLSKAREIQWDYRNIVRRKGRLQRLK